MSQRIPVLANQWDESDIWAIHVSPTNDFILPIVLDFKEQNFDDILSGYDNEPILVFHLSSTIREECEDIKTDRRGIEVLNALCYEVRHFRMILFEFFLIRYFHHPKNSHAQHQQGNNRGEAKPAASIYNTH